ncbi:MAG: RelA/SpoT domain-containing protein [Sphingomonadales bacterium]|nr:RelA/SpoT domain-containing protein [Sphingomonadales bacterium]MDE2172102.1 RelA/SpoT domain-containing protein [Sphingomonadales bacterium]
MTLEDYANGGRALYAEFADAVSAILRAAISEAGGFRLQSIQQRAKDPDSLRVKLAKAGASAEMPIADVAKDLSGCRLIFYTNGDVHGFGQSGILQDNFTVDYDRSKMHYPDSREDGAEFFISENWVVTLNEARCALPEFRRFAGLRCEIQVQTILDHAWAEMAHDTIYKPMAEGGFGAAKIEAMRKRLRKVMQDCLQPAGHAFDKIASDYGQLRTGKAMFDGDALGAIRACADRNALDDAVDRFSNYVLPNYDSYIAAAPEIIEALADAATRAPSMPDVPHRFYHREYPGTPSEAMIAKICRVLESSCLLYAAPEQMFVALLAMHGAAAIDEDRKPITDLARRFAQHDGHAWKQVGPGIQRFIVDRVAAMESEELVEARGIVTTMLREALSSTVTSNGWKAEALVMESGSVAVTDALKSMRRDALNQLERLHGLLADDEARHHVRDAMLAAGRTPNNAGYSDLLGEVIMDDLAHVMSFFTSIVPDLGLEARRQLEVCLHSKYYAYHALPANMAKNPALVAAQARLLEGLEACRAALEGEPDLERYRLLVGHDSVMPVMWAMPGYDYQTAGIERSAGIDILVASVSAETSAEWLDRLQRFVETRSNDLATFLGLQEFIKKLAQAHPDILIGWIPNLGERLSDWLPAILHGLWEAGHGAAIDPLIDGWVAEARHLASIAHYLQFAEVFRFDVLAAITEVARATDDEVLLRKVAIAAARQSARHPDGLFDTIFLPAAQALTARKNFSWTVGMFVWSDIGLLRGLSSAQADALLALMIDVPQLGGGGEELLGIVAEEHPLAVIEVIGKRFTHEEHSDDAAYEDLPYSLYHLRAPLARAPSQIVTAARQWFDADPVLSEFRGGRLIHALFPDLEDPLFSLLLLQIEESREGIDFVLSVLRAFEGQEALHPLLRAIVGRLAADDELLRIVQIVIDSTGVMIGEYGSIDAQKARKNLVTEWLQDDNEAVRAFASSFVKSAENRLAVERRHADRSVAMHKIAYDREGAE